MSRHAAVCVLALYALLAVVVFPVYPNFASPNELTRWALAAAIVEDGSLEVTQYLPILGPRFEDLAERDGRLYSNKPPGAALLALPGYLLARPFVGPPSRESLRASITLMRLFVATLPLLLTALLLLRLGKHFEIDEQQQARIVWLLLFATPLCAYGLLLFSHALVAASLFGAWALLFVLPPDHPSRDVAAGALIGIAVLSEYTAVLPAAVLLIALAFTRGWSRLARVIAGGTPFAIVFGAYHQLAFGHPLRVANVYDRLPEFRALAHSAFLGISLPSPLTLVKLLLDPRKGLLVFSPILILSFLALSRARTRLTPVAFRTLLAVPAAIFLIHAGYPNWHGGWTLASRYVVPAIPFFLVPLLFRERDWLATLLGGWSALAVLLPTLVFPLVPNAFPFPWTSFAAPLLADGLIAPNLGHLLGRAVGIPLPLVIVIAAAACVIRGKQLAFAVAGALLALVIGMTATLLAPEPLLRIQRGYIAEVYFERTGALEEAAGGLGVPPRLWQRRDAEVLVGPARWP